MSTFLLLIRYAEGQPESLSDEQIAELLQEIRAWYLETAKIVPLFPIGRLIPGVGGTVRTDSAGIVLDGPFAESKEALAGLFVLEAEAYERAVEVAGSCPNLSIGGSVEIRTLERGIAPRLPYPGY